MSWAAYDMELQSQLLRAFLVVLSERKPKVHSREYGVSALSFCEIESSNSCPYGACCHRTCTDHAQSSLHAVIC